MTGQVKFPLVWCYAGSLSHDVEVVNEREPEKAFVEEAGQDL